MASIGCVHEAAVWSVKAGDMMRRIDPATAVERYLNAVSLYCELGRFYTAANIERDVAEMVLEDGNVEEAQQHFRQASDYYNGDNVIDQAQLCLLQVGMLAASQGNFDLATETFEQVARNDVEHNLRRGNVPDILLRAGLCQLAAGGPIRKGLKSHKVLRFYLKKWPTIDYTFAYSREKLFLTNLLAIIPELDLAAFADHIYNFDNVAGLDEWCLRMLNRVKEDIEEEIDRIEKARIKEELKAKRLQDQLAGLARPD
uniref:Uncharacterized protein n=1 Tax=Rhizochromulina marina TaxID=1034831 RepID=A0A7S2R3C7_9STRA